METIIKKAIDGGYAKSLLGGKLLNHTKIDHRHFFFTLRKKFERKTSLWGRLVMWKSINCEHAVLDPLFWKALSKQCKWKEEDVHPQERAKWFGQSVWISYAAKFHAINLMDGWDKAIKWLEELVK